MTKLKLYNGEEVVEKGKTKKIDVQELREDTKREGMSGISTRFIMKALDNALSDNVDGNCINPINVRESLIDMVKEADLPDDTRKQYLEFLQDVLHKEYLELLEKEITKALRLLLPGAGRGALPELPRPRRGVREQDERSRTATPARSCSPTRAS